MKKIKSYKLFEMSIPYRKNKPCYNARIAIYNNDKDRLQKIKNDIGTLDLKHGFGMTPLEYACETMRPKYVKYLIDEGCDPNFNDMQCGYIAITSNKVESLKYLIDGGLKINDTQKTKGKLKPTLLEFSINVGKYNMTRLLLENGSDINIKTIRDDVWLINKVTDFECIKTLLDDPKTDVSKIKEDLLYIGYSYGKSWLDDKSNTILEYILKNRLDMLPRIKTINHNKSYKELFKDKEELYKKYKDDIEILDDADELGIL